MKLTIKQAAEKMGIPKDTLRYYDKEGILSPGRSEGGYRHYDDDDMISLKHIVVMKYAHFTLAEIKSMEELFLQNPSTECNEISREILSAKIAGLRQMIRNYQKIADLMEELLPMIDSAESYQENEGRIEAFIEQIYEDIHGGCFDPHASQDSSRRKEV